MVACRFSLARLFVMTGFAAIACAALARPTPFWLPTIVSVTAAFLFYAVLAAIYRVGARGAFWRGMAIVGWGYFLLVFVAHPSSDEHVPLLTTQFIMLVHDLRHPVYRKVVSTMIRHKSIPHLTPTRSIHAFYLTQDRLKRDRSAGLAGLRIKQRVSASSVNACGRFCSAARGD